MNHFLEKAPPIGTNGLFYSSCGPKAALRCIRHK